MYRPGDDLLTDLNSDDERTRMRAMLRRATFDKAADDYDQWRGGYPNDVVEAIVNCSRIGPESRVLEIACGTGQLSVPLAERGVELVAVELGPHLAAFARKNLSRFSKASVETGSFESWPLPPEPFDAVVVANAFHWLEPELRFTKSAQALRQAGCLTIGHAHHVRGGTPGFFEEAQSFYLKWGLSDDPFFQPPTPADAPIMYPEFDGRSEYGSVERRRFEIPRHHTAESYVGWLRTDSMVATLDQESREGFLSDIGQLIMTRYDGVVSRNFLYEVITARKVA
jgi:SAM-dependent methyltransferase